MTTGQTIMWIITILLGLVLVVLLVIFGNENEVQGFVGFFIILYFIYIYIKLRRLERDVSELKAKMNHL